MQDPLAQHVIHETIPAPVRCKITLKQMTKGVTWEVEHADVDPLVALEVVQRVHAHLVAAYGGQASE